MKRRMSNEWSRRSFLQRVPLGALGFCASKWLPAEELGSNQTAAAWQHQVDSLRPLDTSIAQGCVLDDVQLRFRAALAKVKHARTAEEARAAQATLRHRLRHSLGLPQFPWPPSLQPRQAGMLQREGFHIEKIVYQTFPGSLVPALLYVPNTIKKPAPAIILYIGHWWDGKGNTDQQAVCINLARMGFVVLTWDPFGQGERGLSSRDHRRDAALLAGISEQGYAEYETQCALSYLLSRPEVDPERIGMTGASGGGYNTWMTSVLDPRIKVVVPVVGTSEFYEQIWDTRPTDFEGGTDHCHHVAGLVRYANNHELLAAVAPRPLCMIAAQADRDFAADGVLKIYRYGRDLYESFGAPEKISMFVDTAASHGYQVKKREAAYGWFARWLMGQGTGAPIPEPPTETLLPDSPELRCFPVGKNQPAGPGMERIAVAAMEKLPLPVPPANLETVFGQLPSSSQPAISFRPIPSASPDIQRFEFASENGIGIPAFLVKPRTTAWKGVLVGVHDRGKEALTRDPFIESALQQNWAVCGVDPRGIGELAVERMHWVSAASLLMNENFVWRQGWDLRCAVQGLLHAELGASRPFVLYGQGDNASLAVTYTLAQLSRARASEPRAFILRDGFLSFRQFAFRPASMALSYRLRPEFTSINGSIGMPQNSLTAFDHEIPYRYFVFDVLRWLDLPQLLAQTKAEGLVVNPLDGDWKQMSEPGARKFLPPAIRLACESHPEETMLRFLNG